MTGGEREVGVLVERLTDVMLAEEQLYLRMRDLLRREEQELIGLDVERLASIVDEKRALAEEGRLLEESRLAVAETLARTLGLDTSSPQTRQENRRVPTLIGRLGPEAGGLPEVNARLRALVTTTRALLEANESFAGRSLSHVQDTLRLLGRSAAEPMAYGPGRAPSGARSTGRLVRQTI